MTVATCSCALACVAGDNRPILQQATGSPDMSCMLRFCGHLSATPIANSPAPTSACQNICMTAAAVVSIEGANTELSFTFKRPGLRIMSHATDDSDTLLRRAAEGDQAAIAAAFDRFRKRLRRSVAMRLDHRLYGRVDPSDVVQEAFIDVLRRWEEFAAAPDRMPLFLWFRLLASQRLVDLQRQHLGAQMRDATLEISLDRPDLMQVSSIWLAAQLVDRQETGSDVAMRAEVQSRVQARLAEMDPVDREVLAMRHFELLTNQEAALALGISENAASNRYIRALKRLKEILTPDVAGD